MVKNFFEYIEEEYNYITSELGDITFSDRWFYYEPDDEIIYGCDEEPVNQECLFYFNPKSCEVVVDEHVHNYDLNNPLCLIVYKYENNEVKFYEGEHVQDYLESLGYESDDNYEKHKKVIQDIFDKNEDFKFLLMYGNDLLATTFDIIEEN